MRCPLESVYIPTYANDKKDPTQTTDSQMDRACSTTAPLQVQTCIHNNNNNNSFHLSERQMR